MCIEKFKHIYFMRITQAYSLECLHLMIDVLYYLLLVV